MSDTGRVLAVDGVRHRKRCRTPSRTSSIGWFEGFELRSIDVGGGVSINVRTGGNPGGRPLVLLHGFPQTHAMWHAVAPALGERFAIVMIDLRGYGDSSKPVGDDDHANYSKRRMAADVVAVADHLGHDRFLLCGHDRGGCVAHRLALDHAERIDALCVLDIAPTLDMYEGTDMRFALAYYHWFFYVQPHPVPERLIGADPQWYLSTLLGGWGSAGGFIDRRAMDEYVRCFTPAAIHAMCEDYRASVTVDLEHDRASRVGGDRIRCPLHVVWGRRGVIERCFEPLALWQAQAEHTVSGRSLDAGHFLAEELPEQVVAELLGFFGSVTSPPIGG